MFRSASALSAALDARRQEVRLADAAARRELSKPLRKFVASTPLLIMPSRPTASVLEALFIAVAKEGQSLERPLRMLEQDVERAGYGFQVRNGVVSYSLSREGGKTMQEAMFVVMAVNASDYGTMKASSAPMPGRGKSRLTSPALALARYHKIAAEGNTGCDDMHDAAAALNALYGGDMAPGGKGSGEGLPRTGSTNKHRGALLEAAEEGEWIVCGHEAVKRILRLPYKEMWEPPGRMEVADFVVPSVERAAERLRERGFGVRVTEDKTSFLQDKRRAVVTARGVRGATVATLTQNPNCMSYNVDSDGQRVGTPDLVLSYLYTRWLIERAARPYVEAATRALAARTGSRDGRLMRRIHGRCQ